jgi:hypothetical protein
MAAPMSSLPLYMRRVCTTAMVIGILPFICGMRFAEPCCGVISVDSAKGLVTVRHLQTGRTVQFEAGAATLQSIKTGALVEGDLPAGRLTSVGAVTRTFSTFEPAWLEPCCNVVSMRPATQVEMNPSEPVNGVRDKVKPSEPVNGIVTAADKKSGKTFSFGVPKSAMGALKAGQDVDLVASGGWALVKLTLAAPTGAQPSGAVAQGATSSQPLTYSYPVRGVVGAAAQPWEIVPSEKAKGPVGRLVVNIPQAGGKLFRETEVFRPGEAQYLHSTHNGGEFDLLPGVYDVHLNYAVVKNVPVGRGKDTRLFVGLLKIEVPAGTESRVYDASGKVRLGPGTTYRGTTVLALPAGKYILEVAGGRREITIKDRETTEL